MSRLGAAPLGVYSDDGTKLVGIRNPDGTQSIVLSVVTSAQNFGANVTPGLLSAGILPNGALFSSSGYGYQYAGNQAYWRQKLPKHNAAMQALRSGIVNAAGTLFPNILVIGDSTSIGCFANGSESAGYGLNNYESRLAKYLAKIGGFNFENWLGIAGGGVAAHQDTRVTYNGSWNTGNLAGGSMPFGGAELAAHQVATTGDTLILKPTTTVDTVTIYYLKNNGYGKFTVSANGVTSSQIDANSGGAAVIASIRLPLNGASSNAITFTKATTGNLFILGVICELSTNPAPNILAAGCPGLGAVDIAANANPWGPLLEIPALNPSLTIISLNLNDIAQGRSASAYNTAFNTIVTAAQLTGDVLAVTGSPGVISWFSQANQVVIVNQIKASASVLGLPLIDTYSELISGAWLTASNLYGDTAIHLNAAGYALYAQLMAKDGWLTI